MFASPRRQAGTRAPMKQAAPNRGRAGRLVNTKGWGRSLPGQSREAPLCKKGIWSLFWVGAGPTLASIGSSGGFGGGSEAECVSYVSLLWTSTPQKAILFHRARVLGGSNMHVVREPTLQGSGRSGVAVSPHAPFLQPVRLIGRTPSLPSPDGPQGPPLGARVASAPTQNNVPTRPSCMWTLLGIGRGGGAERPGA